MSCPPSAGASGPRGFSAVELLLSLAVLATVLGFTLPGALKSMQTYRRNGAARQVLAEIRKVQSLSVKRSGIVGFQWGGAVSRPASEYRIVRDTNGACSLPAVGAPVDGTDVIRGWTDLVREYPGVSIQSVKDGNDQDLAAVMFNPMGWSVNSCTSVGFPVSIRIVDGSGATRTIEVRASGSSRLL